MEISDQHVLPRRGATPIQNHTSRSQHQSTQRSGLSQHQSTQRSGFYQHQYTQRTRPSSGCDKKTGSARLSNEGSSKSATEARKQESPRSGVIPEKTERDERTIDSAKIPSVSTSRSQSVRSSDFSISTRRGTARTTTSMAMSTARAEATLAVLEAERAQLEYRLKKVEEELQLEEDLAKKKIRNRFCRGALPRNVP